MPQRKQWPKRPGKWKVVNPVHEFEYEQELALAKAELGFGSPIPPVPGTAAYAVAEVNYVMAKSDIEKATEEIVDIRLVRETINRLLGPNATDAQREIALKSVPAIIAAVIRAVKSPAKDEKVDFDPAIE